MLRERKQSLKAQVAAQKEILNSLFGSTGFAPEWEAFILDLPKRKLSRPGQRAQFVTFSYQYIREYCHKNNIELPNNRLNDTYVAKLAVLSELIICCQYYENYIFDGKNGVTTSDLIRKYLNASANLKSVIFRFIRDHFADGKGTEERVRECADTIFNAVNVGQQMEADYNHYSSYKSGLNKVPNMGLNIESLVDFELLKKIQKKMLENLNVDINQRVFFETYLYRVYLTTVVLFEKFTQLIIDLTGVCKQALTPVKKFATCFGYISQMLNDNIDIVELHTSAKIPLDAFSDLRNKNITLPIFFHLIQAGKRWERSTTLNILESDHPDSLIFEHKLTYVEGRPYKQLRSGLKAKVANELTPVIKKITIPGVINICEIANSYLELNLITGKCISDLMSIAYDNRFYREMDLPPLPRQDKKKIIPLRSIYLLASNKWAKVKPLEGFNTLPKVIQPLVSMGFENTNSLLA